MKIEEVFSYSNNRRNSYNQLEEQLDMLYKDIKAGLFGENALNGTFFKHIDEIKTNNPKPDNFEQLKLELDSMIESDRADNQ